MYRHTLMLAPACAAVIVGGCDSKPVAREKAASVQQPTRKPIEGYGSIKFGSSFEDVIGTFGGDLFNAAAVSDCFKNLPLKGCSLIRNMKNTSFEMKDGIPYTLSLSFNRYDKLTDIGLNYDREGDISRAQCLEIHERTLDWLTREYGVLRSPSGKQEVGTEKRMTAAKNAYLVWFGRNNSFVTIPSRTVSTALPGPFEKEPIPKWNNDRYISLLTHFIVVDGNPVCGVSVDFQEPESVERAPASS